MSDAPKTDAAWQSWIEGGGAGQLRDCSADLECKLDDALVLCKSYERILGEHAEFGALFQPGGRFHDEAAIRLGSSAVAAGRKWLVAKLDEARAELAEVRKERDEWEARHRQQRTAIADANHELAEGRAELARSKAELAEMTHSKIL